ncbi:MAG TPA: beta-N-acetylhexosaminidase [Pedobacter sp.]|uniref:beta-N-acetylhexosaminidase n=1 Tax=Pedobacter sp. TaxID=1411316 RepID=UPI002C274F49|nr:beta-N-acetylhexosaminidase [Pedobacter sp.]HMI05483.1 beta-N-acetylhexosaminidase [Pedobacter sp.]
MKTLLSALFSLLLFTTSKAQLPAIIPQPVELRINAAGDKFTIDNGTLILVSDTALIRSAVYLKDYLLKYYGITLHTDVYAANEKKKNTIRLIRTASTALNPGQYMLNVLNKNISINAPTDEGIFYAVQTLLQLLPVKQNLPLDIPSVDITDYPRFTYRGMHLDVSRHFFDVAFVKKYIDYLAMHKLNYFHWHLTDDHGWRIEIKKHPKLTDIGAWRNGTITGLYPGTGNDGLRYGGYYTQEEVKEVIKYAADRYINVIPEIEMPAHSMSALAAYPEFGTEPSKKYEVAQTWGIFNKFNNVFQPTEQTFKFLEEVLTEVIELFPSKYIHIGGDEGSKIWWKQSALSQQIMKENGLKDESALQSYFIHRIEKFVNSKGKTIIGWDEILDGGLAPNAIVMSWRGEKGGIAAAKQKHMVVMTPENAMYFNHSQFLKEDSLTAAKFLPLSTVYSYEPVPAILTAEESKYIWGAQGNLWSEYIASSAKAEYMLFPRLDALSEVLWSPRAKKDYGNFQQRLKTQLKRYDLLKINYSKQYLGN